MPILRVSPSSILLKGGCPECGHDMSKHMTVIGGGHACLQGECGRKLDAGFMQRPGDPPRVMSDIDCYPCSLRNRLHTERCDTCSHVKEHHFPSKAREGQVCSDCGADNVRNKAPSIYGGIAVHDFKAQDHLPPDIRDMEKARKTMYAGLAEFIAKRDGIDYRAHRLAHRATWIPKLGGWDVTCKCGWESRTGGAIRPRVKEYHDEHVYEALDEHRPDDVKKARYQDRESDDTCPYCYEPMAEHTSAQVEECRADFEGTPARRGRSVPDKLPASIRLAKGPENCPRCGRHIFDHVNDGSGTLACPKPEPRREFKPQMYVAHPDRNVWHPLDEIDTRYAQIPGVHYRLSGRAKCGHRYTTDHNFAADPYEYNVGAHFCGQKVPDRLPPEIFKSFTRSSPSEFADYGSSGVNLAGFVRPDGSVREFDPGMVHDEAWQKHRGRGHWSKSGWARIGYYHGKNPEFFASANHKTTEAQHATIRSIGRRAEREGHAFNWECEEHDTPEEARPRYGSGEYEKHFGIAKSLFVLEDPIVDVTARSLFELVVDEPRMMKADEEDNSWSSINEGQRDGPKGDQYISRAKCIASGEHMRWTDREGRCNGCGEMPVRKSQPGMMKLKPGERGWMTIRGEGPMSGRPIRAEMGRGMKLRPPAERRKVNLGPEIGMREYAPEESKSIRALPHEKAHADDLLKQYRESSPEQRKRGHNWYPRASQIVDRYAGQHEMPTGKKVGYSRSQISGALAALSPRQNWGENVFMLDRVVRAHQHGTEFKRVRGLGFRGNGQKAWRILGGADPSEVLGEKKRTGQKVRAFHHALENFDGKEHADHSKCDQPTVIDQLMDRAMHGSQKPNHRPTNIDGRVYREHSNAVRVAAMRAGVEPWALQATVWAKMNDEGGKAPRVHVGAEGQPHMLKLAGVWPGSTKRRKLVMKSQSVWRADEDDEEPILDAGRCQCAKYEPSDDRPTAMSVPTCAVCLHPKRRHLRSGCTGEPMTSS